MKTKLLVSTCVAGLLASCLYGQGNDTKATKADWEEVNFEFNSSILSDGYPTLLRLAELLQQHGDYRLKVEGHTDYVGSDGYNEKLALSRSAAVKSFLVKYGARDAQILTSGQGKRVPEVPNTSKEGRFINRRVVMTLTDGSGKIIAAGGAPEIVNTMDDRLKKLEDCCSQILKKLDKLDEILAALRDLKNENERLKSDVAALKQGQVQQVQRIAEAPKPLTPQQTGEIAKTEVAKAIEEVKAKENPKFSLLGVNVGPTMAGEVNFNARGRYFAPFGESGMHAVQAEGEYMYYGGKRIEGRQEGQFDIGLVNRWGPVQAGLFSSFKYVNLRQFQSGGTLGQGAFTLDYIFNRGRVGFFGTKGFRDNVTVNRVQLGTSSWIESYLKIVDQYGGSALVGAWGDSYVEGNLGYLRREGRDGKPGGMLRLVQPIAPKLAFTVEAGLNESLITADNSGRIVFGLQFGNTLRPKEYGSVKHPVPVDIPRVRYEVLTRRIGNSAPVADAGPDQIGVDAGTKTIDGSASYDPDGDPLTFAWTQISGPTVSVTGMNTARATFIAAEGQTYIFRLVVRDPGGLQSTARVTVSTRSAPQVRILRFNSQPNVIKQGQSSTLIWQVENAETVEISSIGQVDARGGTSVVAPRETTVYRLTARNRSGEVNETATVTVERQDVRILRCLATPATILPGEVSTLAWETEFADQVSISGIGAVRPNGTATVSPTATTTYTLTARGPFGEVTCNMTVQVTPGQQPRIIRFTSTPVEILPTEQASLIWQVENATEITITGIGRVEPTGTSTVSPKENTTYTITATNQHGTVSSATTVGVITPVKILDFVATPSTVTAPNSVTLSWKTENATEVIITGVGAVQANGSVTVRPTADVSYTLLA
ncbi:MAG: OmpA family protein, partial [Bryobacteraceae bacterium]